MRIAVPITAKSMDEALKDMDEAEKQKVDIIELRIDYMKRPNLERLLKHSQIPKIVTNRHESERGMFKGPEERRIAYLQEAVDLDADYVDIEYHHYNSLIENHFAKKSTKLIVSFHDFDGTIVPALTSIYERIKEKNPDIIKIATKANNYSDSTAMLNLVAKSTNTNVPNPVGYRPMIGICMGEKGVMTRVLGPVYGSYLTFASLTKEKASAPGQLTVAELRNAWQLLQLK